MNNHELRLLKLITELTINNFIRHESHNKIIYSCGDPFMLGRAGLTCMLSSCCTVSTVGKWINNLGFPVEQFFKPATLNNALS